jgi:beta-1,4-N-acetylglucosaminyltransferase
MHVFVTVGTTQFNELIETMSSPKICDLLAKNGKFTSMTLQIGNGSFVPNVNVQTSSLSVQYFTLKPTISDEMEKADLIVSHAGAGSLFEALRLKKKVIAVVNESLMDNHQRELADVLHREHNLIMTTYTHLEQLFSTEQFFSNTLANLLPLEEPCTSNFAQLVNTEMGLIYSFPCHNVI